MGILKRMVEVRIAEKPETRLAPFKDDIAPLWEALLRFRAEEDPAVDMAYEAVKSVFQPGDAA